MEQSRRRLPEVRQSITHHFVVGNHDGYIIVGLYEDGTPGELFLNMSKEGSTLSGLMDCFAITFSLAIQYGVPLKALVDKLSYTHFEPSGMTGHPELRIAHSVIDYVVRWMALRFLNEKLVENPGDTTVLGASA